FRHVDLSDVRGVRFNGCDFKLSSSAQNVDEFNYAILASRAGFSVNANCNSTQTPCSDYDKCTFSGFDRAIGVSNFGSTNTFYVNKAIFDNNVIGIQMNSVSNQIIVQNTFNVGSLSQTECAYGLYMELSTGFSIEENDFIKLPGAVSKYTTGINTYNTYGVDDIYKNTFSNLTNGNYCIGINFLKEYWSGLQFLCNNNTGNYADFYVSYTDIIGDNIQARQGNRLLPAANTFSPNATWHFYNGGESLVGYYYRNIVNENPDSTRVHRVTREFTTAQPANLCISHYGTGDPKDKVLLNDQERIEAEYTFANAIIDYNNVEILYNELKDGGSTENTIDKINIATPETMLSVKNELLMSSPHLSEEVLRLLSERTEVFPNIAIFDVLAANPDELKKDDLLKYLEEKENPLPNYMIDILRQVSYGTSYKTVLQEEMNKYSHIKSSSAHSIIRSILNSESVNYNDLRAWLENYGGIESDKQIINSYLDEGNIIEAQMLAQTLASKYNLSGDELIDNEDYITCLNLCISLKNTNRLYSELNQEELSVLDNIIANNTRSANSFAKSIKTAYNSTAVCDCPEIVDNTLIKSQTIDLSKLTSDYGFAFSVYPNPIKYWATFDYVLPLNQTNGVIEIKDINGKFIQSITIQGHQGQIIWDSKDLPAGQYLYNVVSGSYMKTGKMMIVK
ncbi:MAG: T9SS type A sorting domain-containing protein, partial [Clostridiales bacterium]